MFGSEHEGVFPVVVLVFPGAAAARAKHLPLLVPQTQVQISFLAVAFVEHFAKGQIP